MRKMSKRARLRRLIKLHPDWSNHQLARALGQTVDAVRAAKSVMGITTKYRPRPGARVPEPPPPPPRPAPSVSHAASCVLTRQVGYLKLL